MCGIWSYLQFYNNKEKFHKILADFWNISNRGPDNSVLETYNNIAIGFHRLGIMDNSFQSNQPFIIKNELKTNILICNGEIYNFKELIKKYDLDISSNSDCLTILKLYQKFDKLNDISSFLNLFSNEIKGEFAFVLYEFDNFKNLRKLFIGRDQIGIRPLYCNNLTNNVNEIYLSSEIKGMSNYEDKVYEFTPGKILYYSFDELGNTNLVKKSFDWVYSVKPEILKILDYKEELENKLLLGLRNAVINSVRRRLNADRPLAFLLSGGVDSSLVCAIASRILKKPINTFCCGMSEGTDIKYARLVSDHIKSNHTEVFFSEDEGFQSIPDVIRTVETWDTTTVRASVGQYIVSKYIGTKTDYKVVLVGEGPDEVCSSYMFNWNAPNGKELHDAALKYVKNIHYYDCKRGDRCISNFGLEGRVPLLDPEVIEAYWKIPADWRHPKYKGIEKWWLRKAFDDMDLLPNQILWRKKEAFSDGVSSNEKSWFKIIQDRVDKLISSPFKGCPTKEATFYKQLFVSIFSMNRLSIIPEYWQPMWTGSNKYIDPSARVLNAYNSDLNNKLSK